MTSLRTARSNAICVQSLIAPSLGVLIFMLPLLCSAQLNTPLTGQMQAPAPRTYSAVPTPAYVTPALPSDMPIEPVPATQPIMTATPIYQTQSYQSQPTPALEARAQMQPQAPTFTEPNSRPVPRKVPGRLGAETRAIVAAQADGRAAGPELPILGPVASSTWKRYLDSFGHPIPEAFAAKVGSGGGSSGGSGGN